MESETNFSDPLEPSGPIDHQRGSGRRHRFTVDSLTPSRRAAPPIVRERVLATAPATEVNAATLTFAREASRSA